MTHLSPVKFLSAECDCVWRALCSDVYLESRRAGNAEVIWDRRRELYVTAAPVSHGRNRDKMQTCQPPPYGALSFMLYKTYIYVLRGLTSAR